MALWCFSTPGGWAPYAADDNAVLEAAFVTGQQNVKVKDWVITFDRSPHHKHIQTRQRDPTRRREVQRQHTNDPAADPRPPSQSQWMFSSFGGWKPYSAEHSAILEREFEQGSASVNIADWTVQFDRSPKKQHVQLRTDRPSSFRQVRRDQRDQTLHSQQQQQPRAKPPRPYNPPDVDSTSCVICRDDFEAPLAGVFCSPDFDDEGKQQQHTPHFVCDTCFEQHVKTESEKDIATIEKKNAQVFCPNVHIGCHSAAYSDKLIAVHVTDATFHTLMKNKAKVAEKVLVLELEREYQAKMKAELDKLRAMDDWSRELHTLRLKIVEEVLTLKCPRCRAAFTSFSGCSSVTCHRCNAVFCGLCTEGGPALHFPHVCPCAGLKTEDAWQRVKQLRMNVLFETGLVNKDPRFQRDMAKLLATDLHNTGVVFAAVPTRGNINNVNNVNNVNHLNLFNNLNLNNNARFNNPNNNNLWPNFS